MSYFTSNTYQLKRKILSFSNKISERLTKPQAKVYSRYHLRHSRFWKLPFDR